MSRKILFIALTIALAAALIGGGTMATFTAKAEVDNEFTAGTVLIDAGTEVVYPIGEPMDNVNPGDAFKKCIPIENTGTKNIRLSMTADLGLDINWGWIGSNFDELCFSGDWADVDALQSAVLAALLTGNVTNPADAVGDPNGPFDEAGKLVIPIMVAPTANGDWFMKEVGGEKVFFYDGILEPGAETKLCVIVVFDGPWMGNLWQGATFTLGGRFEAVQSSNEAPEAFWGTDVWQNYEAVSSFAGDPKAQLEVDFSPAYVDYFYDNDTFIYAYLCDLEEQNGNGNGNGEFVSTGSAWGEGTPYGPGVGFKIAMYFEYVKGSNLTVELELQEGATRLAVGDIWVDGNGTLFVSVSTEGYFYDGDPNKPMAMTEAQLYASTEIPTQTAPGQFPYEHKPAQPFTDHIFEVTLIHDNAGATGEPDVAISDLAEDTTIYLALHAVTGYIVQ